MRRYYNNFLRYQVLFVVIWLVVTGLSVVFLHPTSTYKAEATLWAQEPLSITQYNNLVSEGYQTAATNLQTDWSQLVHTANFLDKVNAVIAKDGFKFDNTTLEALDNNIAKNYSITALGDYVIQVSYSDIDPKITLEVTNDVIQVYIEQVSGQIKNQNESAIQLLQAQADDAKKKLDQANSQLQQFSALHPDVLQQSQNPNNDLNDVTSTTAGLDLQTLQQTVADSSSNYSTLENQLEQMEIDFQSYVDGRSSIIKLTDNPIIVSYTNYTPTLKILAGLVVGITSSILLSLIVVWILTWSEGGLREKDYAKETLGVKLLLELPASPLLVAASADSSSIRSARISKAAQNFRRNRYVLTTFLVSIFLIVAGIVGYGTGKDPLLTIVLLVFAILVLSVSRWPVWGLLLATFIVLPCETFALPDGISNYTVLPLTNMNFYTSIPLSATPLELLLVSTALISILKKGFRREKFFDRSLMSYLMLIFVGFIIFGLAYGLGLKHGDFKTAEWEVRAILYVPLVYFLTIHLMKSRKAWVAFNWIFPIGVSFLICLSIERYFVLLVPTNPDLALYQDSLNGFNHETALMSVVLIGWCLIQLFLRGSLGEKFVSILLVSPAFLSILISNRRSAFSTMVGIGVILMAVLFYKNRKLAITLAALGGAGLFGFTKVFSHSSGILGELANSFSLSGAAPGTRDYYSNLYRIVEKNNVIMTIKLSPLTGVGFGQPFVQFIHYINLDGFVFQFYTPHIQILWLWLKLGAIGWGVFWFIICITLFKLGQIIKREKGRIHYDVSLLAGSIIFVILLYAYVDLSLVNTRFMMLLGISIGVIELAYRNLPKQEYKLITIVKKTVRRLAKPTQQQAKPKEEELVAIK